MFVCAFVIPALLKFVVPFIPLLLKYIVFVPVKAKAEELATCITEFVTVPLQPLKA